MSEKCPEFFYGNCPIIKTENKELIREFLADILAWLNGDIPKETGGDPEIEYWIQMRAKYEEMLKE